MPAGPSKPDTAASSLQAFIEKAPQTDRYDLCDAMFTDLCARGEEIGRNNARLRRRYNAMKEKRARWYEGYEEAAHGVFITRTPEFRRIAALPVWDSGDIALAVELLTKVYRTPTGRQTVRPIQAAILKALFENSGCFGSVGVGEGKTLATYLAPNVMKAKRPVLVVPAKLRAKTEREFEEIAEDWERGADIKVVSYNLLSNRKTFLEDHSPDLLMFDEVHKLKNRRAACTRQVGRYMEARTSRRDCPMLALTGSASSRSIMELWHILRWCLGDDMCPLPTDELLAKAWARAVDLRPGGNRIYPGWLREFVAVGELPSNSNVRKGVGRRIFSTPGALRTTETTVQCPIIIEPVEQKIPQVIKDMIAVMKETRETPRGDVVLPPSRKNPTAEPGDLWRVTRQLVQGFYYIWDPLPPEPWLAARRIWRAFVREVVEADIGYDSERWVALACANGDLRHNGRYTRWKNIESTFKPKSKTVWVTEDAVKQYADILMRKGPPCLMWVEHQAVGDKLFELTGVPYFRSEGYTADKKLYIEELKGKRSAILSLAANFEGRNLQAWYRNYIVTPPTTGYFWEQLIGRTVRPGQLHDEVYFWVYMGLDNAFESALLDAQHQQELTGHPQKLLLADIAA